MENVYYKRPFLGVVRQVVSAYVIEVYKGTCRKTRVVPIDAQSPFKEPRL